MCHIISAVCIVDRREQGGSLIFVVLGHVDAPTHAWVRRGVYVICGRGKRVVLCL